ncbi:MAG: RHS repeat-associated core domain-containing protein [Chitinophagales bacterium]
MTEITVENSYGELIRKYNFKYSSDNVNSYLSEIEEVGNDGTSALNSTIFDYNLIDPTLSLDNTKLISYNPNSFFNGSNSGKSFYVKSGDFNGDGLTDILLEDGVMVGNDLVVDGFRILKKGVISPNTYDVSYTSDYFTQGQVGNPKQRDYYHTVMSCDFNGDGRDDIFVNKIGLVSGKLKLLSSRIYYPNEDATACNMVSYNPPANYDEIDAFTPSHHVGDFDGDGNKDIFYLLKGGGSNIIKYFISYPSRNIFFRQLVTVDKPQCNQNGYLFPAISLVDKRTIADLDGDGKSEMILQGVNNTNPNRSKFFILKFEEDISTQTSYIKYYLEQTTPTQVHSLRVGDFNGDGKSDVLFSPSDLSNTTTAAWQIGYSNGNTMEFKNFNFSSNVGSDDFLELSDFNSDGKTDIMHGYYNFNTSTVKQLKIYYSGTQVSNSINFPNNKFLNGSKYNTLGDFNGDGKIDIFTLDQLNTFYSFYHLDCGEGHLKRVKNGLGSETIFNYKTLANGGSSLYVKNYDNSSTFNDNLYLKIPVKVVSNYTTDDGKIDISYKYLGAIFNKHGRGFLGYREIIATDNLNQERSITYFNKYGNILGFPDAVFNDYTKHEKFDGTSYVELSSSRNYFENGNVGSNRLWLKQFKTESTSFLNGNSTTNFTYDNSGNLTNKEEINPDGNTVSTSFNYGTNGGNKPALPESSTITYSRVGTANTISYTTSFEYNTLKQLKKKVEFVGLSKTITKEYLYNSLGCVTEEKITGTGLASRIYQTIYTSDDKYVSKLRNPLNQDIDYVMDTKLNLPTSITGADGLMVVNTYDAFSRKLTETSPTGKINTTEYLWDNTMGFNFIQSIYKIKETSASNPVEEEYFDRTGKTIGTKVQQFNGGYLVFNNYHDSKGRVYKTTNYEAGNPSLSEQYSIKNYDFYGRVESESIRPKGGNNPQAITMATYSYNKGSNYWETTKTIPASTTNASGRTYYSKTTFAGELMESNENGTNTLTYTYNPEGKILKTINNGIAISDIEYDEWGRQKQLTDASGGKQIYEYTSLGELKKQINPNDGFIIYEYDVLGRKTKETINEGTVNYSYFPSGSGAKTNLLKEVKGYNSQYKEEYDYDAFGRLNSTKKYVKGSLSPSTALTTTYTYNSDGKITNKITPLNDYQYHYTALGFLEKITCPSFGGLEIYKLNTLSTTGMPTSYSIGSQVTNLTYDKFDRVTSIQSALTPKAGWSNLIRHIDDEYEWDEINGNLISKNENAQRLNYTYEYDNFERLTYEYLTPGTRPVTLTNSAGYNDDGNILGKESVASEQYEYHSPKQFAVKSLSDVLNFSPYKQEVFYSSFNKPYKLTQEGYELSYIYNHGYDRVSATMKKNGALLYKRYYSGSTELTYDASNNVISEIDYIYAGDQLVAMYTNLPNSGGGTMGEFYRVHTDYQNTVRAVSSFGRSDVYYQNFDAWGNHRENDCFNNPGTLGDLIYGQPSSLPIWLYRGYTSHEYLPELRLINMNARLYDPHVARMLSPDNFVQTNSLQGLNRYSYCNNNPLKYTDPDGNLSFIPIIAGAVIGAWVGGTIANDGNMNPIEWKYNSNTFTAMGLGALIGGASAFGAVGVSALGGGAMLSGGAAGAISGAGFAAMQKRNVLEGALWGAMGGVISGGTAAAIGGWGGAAAGGIASSGAVEFLQTGRITPGSLITAGVVSTSVYFATSYAGWRWGGGSKMGEIDVSFRQYMGMQADFQKSRFWKKEYGGFLMNDGSYSSVGRGDDLGMRNVTIPVGAKAFFHSHWAAPNRTHYLNMHNDNKISNGHTGNARTFVTTKYFGPTDMSNNFKQIMFNRFDGASSHIPGSYTQINPYINRFFLNIRKW